MRLLISAKVIEEFQPRLTAIIANAPRPIELIPFDCTRPTPATALDTIEAAYYSRDIWEGTDKSSLSAAAKVFWSLIEQTPRLQWIHVFSSGTDQSHYQQMLRRGVRLTTGAGAQAEAVGMAAVSGLLALARRLPHYWAAQQRRAWAPLRGKDLPRDLGEQTAIVIGTGRLGTVIGRALHTFGMRTIGVRKQVAPTEHFDDVVALRALDRHLPNCDWLLLACPLNAETRGLIDARRLALLPHSAGVVNIARGELIDEPALINALQNGTLAWAFLDVFAVEPLAHDSPLWALPNVLVSPHNAGASSGTYARGVGIFLDNLQHYVHSEPLQNEASQ